MTSPTEFHTALGQPLRGFPLRESASQHFERETLKTMLLSSPAVVDQGMIDLERCGYCVSDAWSRPLPTPQNQIIIQLQPSEILRLHKRWLPLTGQRIFL